LEDYKILLNQSADKIQLNGKGGQEDSPGKSPVLKATLRKSGSITQHQSPESSIEDMQECSIGEVRVQTNRTKSRSPKQDQEGTSPTPRA